VPGVPLNATPARVLNLSLGSLGECTLPYRNAVEELRARNVLVVAAAGNDGVNEVASPGNCPGVVSVTSLRHVGTKVGFANFGAVVIGRDDRIQARLVGADVDAVAPRRDDLRRQARHQLFDADGRRRGGADGQPRSVADQ
jgi:subtilisin family serine protease